MEDFLNQYFLRNYFVVLCVDIQEKTIFGQSVGSFSLRHFPLVKLPFITIPAD